MPNVNNNFFIINIDNMAFFAILYENEKELSVKTGINQADISKFETGVRKPSLKILEKIANALDMVLKIEFVPKRYA